MNNFEIESAKEKYKKLVSEKERLNQIKSRILELEKNPIVKEYLELIDTVNDEKRILDYNENEMSHMAFYDIAKNTYDSNRILVYMGAYSQNLLTGAVSLVTSSKADFLRYYDLETVKCYRVKPSQKSGFEQKYRIIHLEGLNAFSKTSEYENKYKELRNQFFRDLLTMPQEDAVQKIIKGK